jgi:hypothetical protein
MESLPQYHTVESWYQNDPIPSLVIPVSGSIHR